MTIAASIEDQSGYTLLETVVALALFVSVLIPLGTAVGKLMLSDDSDMIHRALQVAETEMCTVIPKDEAAGRTSKENNGFVVVKDVVINGDLVQIKLAVASTKKSDKTLVSLQKTFLGYR